MRKSGQVLRLATLLLTMAFGQPLAAETTQTESTRDFGECRALLQAYAGAVSGKLAIYQIDTPERLESTFQGRDGTLFTITCIASERRMIVVEDK
jgi:hypothetical protein